MAFNENYLYIVEHTENKILKFTIPLFIDDFSAQEKIVLFPNLVYNYINVQTDLEIEKIEIFDMNGRRVISCLGNLKKHDVSHLNNGIYILKIYGENTFIMKRIIKQ